MPKVVPQRARTVTPSKRANSFDPDVAVAFGRVVRRERLNQRIAQDALALSAAIDRSYFGKLERGERQPSLSVLLKIAKALGISGSTMLQAVETELRASEQGSPDQKAIST